MRVKDFCSKFGLHIHCIFLGVGLGINIAMIAIGVKYNNVCTSRNLAICDMKNSCNIEIVPQFLQISGGIMIAFATLYLSCGMCVYGSDSCCCDREDVCYGATWVLMYGPCFAIIG